MSSMLRVEFATVLLASTFALSCSDAEDNGPGFGGETVAISADASDVDEDGGNASSETGPLLDLGGDTTVTDGDDEECEKIDLLFVIDNSRSMETEQAFLQEAFPAFVSAIEGVLPAATDFHVGVTTTDSNGLVPGTFNQQPDFGEDSCVTTLGALVTRATPEGGNTAYGEGCGFASSQPFMTNTDNLATEFACAAEVGIYGYTGEAHAGALVTALSGELNGAGGCNEGFLRDDALLVTIIISDEDDSESLPDTDDAARVEGWFQAISAAKGGIESNVVFVLISGGSPKWPNCPDLDLGGTNGAGESTVLTMLADRFTNRFLGNVCEQGYASIFAESIGTIETACMDFTPID